jgi:hypothetical protein
LIDSFTSNNNFFASIILNSNSVGDNC